MSNVWTRPRQARQKTLPVNLVIEDPLPPIAATHHVIRGAFEFDPNFSRHPPIEAVAFKNCKKDRSLPPYLVGRSKLTPRGVTGPRKARKKDWGCPDLTDSGLGVKTQRRSPHETQLSKPGRERANYGAQYKQEALELWRGSGRSAAKVAAELGIRPPLLYRWARLERLEKEPGNAGGKPSRSLGQLEAEPGSKR
jgi:transposase-like protein